MRKLLFTAIILAVISVVFAYGVWTGLTRKHAYKWIRTVYRTYQLKSGSQLSDPRYTQIEKRYGDADVDSLITFRKPEDISAARQRVIDLIWKDARFPTHAVLTSVETDVEDRRYDDLDNLERIDRYVNEMEYGINSVIYHFHPSDRNNRLILYHQGHFGDFYLGKDTIRSFLEKGYDVVAFAMPLRGMNATPVVRLDRVGPVLFSYHNHFYLMESEDFCALKFFLEPVAVTLNYLHDNYSFDSVYMLGISGGGWTTLVYSAIDTRIERCYPIAHSAYPMFLREIVGDYEQLHAKLYRTANYLELYIMATHPRDRRQMQLFNQYDPSCCWGIRYELYLDKIKGRLGQVGGGEFDVYLDSSHFKHMLSRQALQVILDDMRSAEETP
jgi:hypothetical protein